jgi:rhodanese-related sulfurtransferase
MYSIKEIDATELKSLKDEGKKFRLLDVRSIAEIQRGCIEGCEPIPLNILPAKLSELDTDETYILYCHSGARSAQATGFMAAQGFNETYNLKGGILSCASKGFDIAAYA